MKGIWAILALGAMAFATAQGGSQNHSHGHSHTTTTTSGGIVLHGTQGNHQMRTHGGVVSQVARTHTSGTMNHGQIVSAVARRHHRRHHHHTSSTAMHVQVKAHVRHGGDEGTESHGRHHGGGHGHGGL